MSACKWAQAAGNAAHGLAGSHPGLAERGKHVGCGRRNRASAITRRRDEQLLDLRRRVRLLGGHDRGADEHAVHRHERMVVTCGPFARDIVGGAFRGADAAADDEHEIALLAHLGIRVEQQVVKRLPAVVAPGGAAFDLHENVRGRNRLGDAHHLANLVHGARLEAHIRGTPRR